MQHGLPGLPAVLGGETAHATCGLLINITKVAGPTPAQGQGSCGGAVGGVLRPPGGDRDKWMKGNPEGASGWLLGTRDKGDLGPVCPAYQLENPPMSRDSVASLPADSQSPTQWGFGWKLITAPDRLLSSPVVQESLNVGALDSQEGQCQWHCHFGLEVGSTGGHAGGRDGRLRGPSQTLTNQPESSWG